MHSKLEMAAEAGWYVTKRVECVSIKTFMFLTTDEYGQNWYGHDSVSIGGYMHTYMHN